MKFVSGVLVALPLACQPGPQPQSVDEYQVKAAFVARFADFVEWPAETFTSPQEPLAICVLGQNPFGRVLADLVAGKSTGHRPLELRQVSNMREAGGCRVLFIASSEHLRLRAILSGIRGTGVFSVGDTSDFIAEGGIARLRVEDGRVCIELNADAAKKENLRISARLMQVATTPK